MADPGTAPTDPVPDHLVGEHVEMRYVHDGEEETVTGILQRADGGYVVLDGHRVVPVIAASVVRVDPAAQGRDG